MTTAAKKPRGNLFKRPNFSKVQLLVAFILVFAAIGGHAIQMSFAAGTGRTVNLYLGASAFKGNMHLIVDNTSPVVTAANVYVGPAGSDSCARSSSPVSYSSALSATNVCKTWQEACNVTHGGDMVGVKDGTYNGVLGGYAGDHSIIDGDCSGGTGGDWNPNAAEQGVSAGSQANWVTFRCADESPCFYIPQPEIGAANNSTDLAQNLEFKSVWMGGLDIAGGKDIYLFGGQIGPSVKCASDDMTNLASRYRCDPNGPWFEAQYANFNPFGDTPSGCSANGHVNCGGNVDGAMTEPYIRSAGSGAVQVQNVRVQGVWIHDIQALTGQVDNGGNVWHTSCMLTNDAGRAVDYNLVIDGITCERDADNGIQNEQDGTTIENSVFACPTDTVGDTIDDTGTATWARCTLDEGGNDLVFSRSPISNFIIRYNTFLDTTTGTAVYFAPGYSFTSTRMVGNLGGKGLSCVPSGTGNISDYNVFYDGNSSCGTHAQAVTGNPITDSDAGTAYSDTTQINVQLSGSPAIQTVPNLGSDYALSFDITGGSRTFPTSAGAYQSGSGTTSTPGDLNADGQVDATDLSILLSDWSTNNSVADINHDGIVNVLDLSILLSHYGS